MADRQMDISSNLALSYRKELPDALRVLLDDFPRDAWADHPNYSELIAFWLDRHLMFRRLTENLRLNARSALDRTISTDDYRQRHAHVGGVLLHELHGHHQIEDRHYFPVMATLDRRVRAGFVLLDKDHHELNGLLAGFADRASSVLSANPNDKGHISRQDRRISGSAIGFRATAYPSSRGRRGARRAAPPQICTGSVWLSDLHSQPVSPLTRFRYAKGRGKTTSIATLVVTFGS